MSQRRMFSPLIIDSDAFLEMPASAQNLYFHLGMRADDDGFVGNPKKILRMVGGGEDDFKILQAKRFILTFESGVIVIKHWRINNLIRKDWYKETVYLEEKGRLFLKENGAYTDTFVNENATNRLRRLGKVSLVNIFNIPSIEEVKTYCLERKNKVDPEAFINFYESKGWMIGKNKMKDWRAAVRTWETNMSEEKSNRVKLHDGGYAIMKFGSWVLESDNAVKLDSHYYPELNKN